MWGIFAAVLGGAVALAALESAAGRHEYAPCIAATASHAALQPSIMHDAET